jgi:hypothetical protein
MMSLLLWKQWQPGRRRQQQQSCWQQQVMVGPATCLLLLLLLLLVRLAALLLESAAGADGVAAAAVRWTLCLTWQEQRLRQQTQQQQQQQQQLGVVAKPGLPTKLLISWTKLQLLLPLSGTICRRMPLMIWRLMTGCWRKMKGQMGKMIRRLDCCLSRLLGTDLQLQGPADMMECWWGMSPCSLAAFLGSKRSAKGKL